MATNNLHILLTTAGNNDYIKKGNEGDSLRARRWLCCKDARLLSVLRRWNYGINHGSTHYSSPKSCRETSGEYHKSSKDNYILIAFTNIKLYGTQ